MNRSRPDRVDPDRSQLNGQPPGQSLDRGGSSGHEGGAVGRADPDLAPFTALLTALTEVADLVADEHAAERRAIVQASPELQERGLTKFAAVTGALAAALEQRGAEAATAALLAPVGTVIFRAAFDRWAEQPERASLAGRIRETAAELAANMQPAAPAGGHRTRPAAGRAT